MVGMARRFLVVTVCLVATVVVPGRSHCGRLDDARAGAVRAAGDARRRCAPTATAATGPLAGSFADIAEQLNPAVVNIDATTRDGVARAAPASTCRCRTALMASAVRPSASARARGAAPAPGSSSTRPATS